MNVFVGSHEDNYLIGRAYLNSEKIEWLTEHKEVLVEQYNLSDNFCVAVSDGMGGHEKGEYASYLTVKYLSDHYEEIVNDVGFDEKLRFLTRLNSYFTEESSKRIDTKDMAATLTGVISVKRKIYGFNVGDSRLYSYSMGELKQISKDNTEGQRLLDLGILSDDELKNFPNKKAIYKYIGIKTELIPDIYDLTGIKQGSYLILCSDGLSDALSKEEIQEIVQSSVLNSLEKTKGLVERAVNATDGTGDNVTLIIIEL